MVNVCACARMFCKNAATLERHPDSSPKSLQRVFCSECLASDRGLKAAVAPLLAIAVAVDALVQTSRVYSVCILYLRFLDRLLPSQLDV